MEPTVTWVLPRNEERYGDAGVNRPERWIVDEVNKATADSLAPLRANSQPLLTGLGSCAGKNVVMAEIMVTVARTLHQLKGMPELGLGARDRRQFQLEYVFLRGRARIKVQPEEQTGV